MKGKYPNGLRTAIERAGIKPASLARAVDTAPQNIHRLLNGERKLDKIWAVHLAPHIPNATPADLIFPDEEGAPVARAVRVSDWIAAGRLSDIPTAIEDDEEAKSVTEYLPTGEWIAFDVVGDSMNIFAPEGSRIFVDRSQQELQNGKYYAVAVEGQATFKRFRKPPDRLEPASTNPVHDPIFLGPEMDLKVIGRVRKVVTLSDDVG